MMVRTLALLSLFAGGVAYAGETFVVGVEDLFYLPQYGMDGGEYKGFGRAVLDKFAAKKGYAFKYSPAPINRLFQDLVAGRVDFKYPDNPDWQVDLKRGKGVVYSDSVVTCIDGVMVTPENKGKGIEKLKSVGVVIGFTPWALHDHISAGKVKKVENAHFNGLLEQTIRGRVDGAYIGIPTGYYQLREKMQSAGKLVFDPSLPYAKSAFSLSSTKHPKIIEEFNAFLKENATEIAALKKEFKVEEGNDEAK